GARWDRLADEIWIGVEDRLAVRVDDGGIVNDRPIRDYRIKHGVQIAIGAEIVGDGPAYGFGFAGVDASAGQVWSGVGGKVCQRGGKLGGSFLRGCDPLTQ